MLEHDVEGRLPTQKELRASGANTLSAAVDTLGGLAVFGARLQLSLASGRRPNGCAGGGSMHTACAVVPPLCLLCMLM